VNNPIISLNNTPNSPQKKAMLEPSTAELHPFWVIDHVPNFLFYKNPLQVSSYQED